KVPVRTCRMVTDVVTDRIPYCETRREEVVTTQRVCRRVARQVPYTVTRCVPRCVERQVAFEQCYYVPETVCPTTCSNCANGDCQVAPDAANPQPHQTDKPVPQPEGEPKGTKIEPKRDA